MKEYFRTDLAIEEISKISNESIKGVKTINEYRYDIPISKTIIEDDHDDRINKKPGIYYTIDLRGINYHDHEKSDSVSKALSQVLIELLEKENVLDKKGMIIGLGNINITPDSLGPYTIDNIIVTRHLFKNGMNNVGYSEISGYSPGVMGTTGIETSDIVYAIKEKIDVNFIIIVDALASSDTTKVNKTIQITDTGISPGSGVGNKRKEISKEVFGIPVIAVGVPTVVDASTLTTDILEHLENYINKENPNLEFMGSLGSLSNQERKQLLSEALVDSLYEMMVTPKEIDEVIEDLSKIIACSIDMAVHNSLREEYLN